MNIRIITIIAISVFSVFSAQNAIAEKQDKPKVDKPENIKVEKEWKEVDKEGKRQQAERIKEEHRDKTHDGVLTKKLDGTSSIGIEDNKVKYKKSLP